MDGTNVATKHDAVTFAGGWGWPVFPVAPGGKGPAIRRCVHAVDSGGHRLAGDALAEHAAGCPHDGHGFLDATIDVDRVLAWWDSYPDANVGLRTGEPSGTVVLDVDPDGSATFAGLITELGQPPTTTVVRTPRGYHALYRHPGVRVPSSAGKLGPGLDVRADNAYVVTAPSTVDGIAYRWRDDPWPGPPVLPALPAAWVDRLTGREPPVRRFAQPAQPARSGDLSAWVLAAVRGEVSDVAAATPGSRNQRLNAAAFRLGGLIAAGVVAEDRARDALLAAAERCGLGTVEADRTIRSGFTAGRAQPAELPKVAA